MKNSKPSLPSAPGKVTPVDGDILAYAAARQRRSAA